jgi:hypothetical protein
MSGPTAIFDVQREFGAMFGASAASSGRTSAMFDARLSMTPERLVGSVRPVRTPARRASGLVALQRKIGNKAMQRLVAPPSPATSLKVGGAACADEAKKRLLQRKADQAGPPGATVAPASVDQALSGAGPEACRQHR